MSKPYRGKDKIYYVFISHDYLPAFSGTIEMCQRYIADNQRYSNYTYSLDHRPFRPEFK